MLSPSAGALPGGASLPAPRVGGAPLSANAQRDLALIDRILAKHDEQAYGQLMRVYQKPIRYLVARLVPQTDEAEDLVLEIFVRAFRFLPTFKPVFAFGI